MAIIEKVDTICLTVQQLEEATSWYEEVLGLTVGFKGEGYCILDIPGGGIPLTLEEKKGDKAEGYSTYPIFFTKDIESSYTELKEKKVKMSERQSDGTNHFFDLFDLDGNRLQICYWT